MVDIVRWILVCNLGGVIFVVDLYGGSWWYDLGGVISVAWSFFGVDLGGV